MQPHNKLQWVVHKALASNTHFDDNVALFLDEAYIAVDRAPSKGPDDKWSLVVPAVVTSQDRCTSRAFSGSPHPKESIWLYNPCLFVVPVVERNQ